MLRSRRTTVVTLISLLVLVAALGFVVVLRPPRWLLREVAGHHATTLFEVRTDRRAIALTIDDAPHPEVTPGILEVLRRHDAKATFFVIGSYAERHPELVDAIRADGHELGNHLYEDRMSARLAPDAFVRRLRRTHALIRPEGPVLWCRPGSGWITERLARLMAANGYRPCLASAYPMDLRLPEALARWQFLANVRPGAILVLHDGGPGRRKTIRILEEALPRLRARGYEITTVSKLWALAGSA